MPNTDPESDVDVYRDEEKNFTIVDGDNDIFVANEVPKRANGIFQYVGYLNDPYVTWDMDGFGEEIPWDDVPENVQDAIRSRLFDSE